jgi:hypothetical protein
MLQMKFINIAYKLHLQHRLPLSKYINRVALVTGGLIAFETGFAGFRAFRAAHFGFALGYAEFHAAVLKPGSFGRNERGAFAAPVEYKAVAGDAVLLDEEVDGSVGAVV